MQSINIIVYWGGGGGGTLLPSPLSRPLTISTQRKKEGKFQMRQYIRTIVSVRK